MLILFLLAAYMLFFGIHGCLNLYTVNIEIIVQNLYTVNIEIIVRNLYAVNIVIAVYIFFVDIALLAYAPWHGKSVLPIILSFCVFNP